MYFTNWCRYYLMFVYSRRSQEPILHLPSVDFSQGNFSNWAVKLTGSWGASNSRVILGHHSYHGVLIEFMTVPTTYLQYTAFLCNL
jgi:hypothetical protein